DLPRDGGQQALSSRDVSDARGVLLPAARFARHLGDGRSGPRDLGDPPGAQGGTRRASEGGEVGLADPAVRPGHRGARLSDALLVVSGDCCLGRDRSGLMSRRTSAITGTQRSRRSVSRSGIALLVAVTIAMLLLPIDPAAACPTCKDQLA